MGAARHHSWCSVWFAISAMLLQQYLCDDQINEPPQVPSNNSLTLPVATANNINPLIQATLAAVPKVASGLLAEQPERPNDRRVETQPSTTFIEDPIVNLDYSSINDEILRRRTASFVFFNANYDTCRHCYRFITIWKDLASDIRWWRNVIRLYTINCSEEDNIEVCRRAGVSQFPQVKYYWIMSNSLEQDGQRLRILGKSVHALRHMIMDKVMDSYMEHNKLLFQKNHPKPAPVTPAPVSQASNPLLSMLGPLVGMLSGSASGAGSGLSSILGAISGKGGIGGLLSTLGGTQGINQIVNTLTSVSTMRKRLSIQPLPQNWPELEPIEVSDTQQLVDMLPLDVNRNIGALLVMETQEFLYTGAEVMLDLIPYSNQSYIARVKDERSQLTKNLTKRDDIQAPALIYISEHREPKLISTAPKYTNDEDLRRAFVKTFERRRIKYPVKRVWSMQNLANVLNSSESQENEELLEKLNQVYMDDLTNALRVSLMEQVFKHPDLSDDQYNALVKYVYALINYFPFNNEESLKFIKRLHSWLQNQVSPMDIGEYKKQFHDVDDAIEPRQWVACKSLKNSKSIPNKNRKNGFLFENPAQLGKMVSNITRLFRGQQQQASKLKSLFNVFTSNLSQNNARSNSSQTPAPAGADKGVESAASVKAPELKAKPADESPIERIIRSLTSGSLGSDSSILKLISAALTGGGSGDDKSNQGKSKFAREFPCGAWKLAHVMVVNEFIRDSPRKDVKHIVLHSLYQYAVNFYACPTCGNRVSDVIGEFRLNLDDHLQDQGDSILLLWKVHNRINKRLESEPRPGSPVKLQFPSESLCPKCRSAKAQNELGTTPNWHERQVLTFLVHHYRVQSLVVSSNSSDSSGSSTIGDRSARRASGEWLLGACLVLSTITAMMAGDYGRYMRA